MAFTTRLGNWNIAPACELHHALDRAQRNNEWAHRLRFVRKSSFGSLWIFIGCTRRISRNARIIPSFRILPCFPDLFRSLYSSLGAQELSEDLSRPPPRPVRPPRQMRHSVFARTAVGSRRASRRRSASRARITALVMDVLLRSASSLAGSLACGFLICNFVLVAPRDASVRHRLTGPSRRRQSVRPPPSRPAAPVASSPRPRRPAASPGSASRG
jgi:hypothetical protein